MTNKKTIRIAVVAGDGIGPEVMGSAISVLNRIAEKYGHEFIFQEALIGGAAFEKYSVHFPDETREVCEGSDAILFGSVGGPILEADLPKWKDCEKNALLGLRKAFSFHCNLRPAKVYPALSEICPLKESIVAKGVDLLIVRELLGDIYFGEHKTIESDGQLIASDIAIYKESEIKRVARNAFEAARNRRKKLTSVDKANVLDTSKLWRKVVSEVSSDFPEVALEHMLVDNCAMQIIKNPSQFDVILTANLFGDILSDAAAVLPGSLGLTPSASLSESGFGMYEPSGGSAPDIAGKNIANPIAQILSAAMMLEYSFGMIHEAKDIRQAVDSCIQSGKLTADICKDPSCSLGTKEFTRELLSYID